MRAPPACRRVVIMRILVVSDSYPPLIGGATLFARDLARQLVARGHEVAIATSSQANTRAYEHDDGLEVHRLHAASYRVPWASAHEYRRTPPPFPDPELAWRLRRVIRSFRPDLVHSYGWISYSCALALTGLRIPTVISAQDYGNVCALRTLVRHGEICDGPALRKCVECAGASYGMPKGAVAVAGVLGGRRLLRRKMTGLHSISDYVHGFMRRDLLQGKRRTRSLPTATIPDFTAEHEDPPDEAILARLPQEPFILFVGALRRIKGIGPLLEAYRTLDVRPPLVLMGPRAPESPSSFPDGVTVVHDVPHATVLAAWERALFGVAPSLWAEPLGIVVHEAMSRGRAVIGTVPGGHRDMIVPGKTGLLVPAGDVGALRAAMAQLVGDPESCRHMGDAAQRRAASFEPSALMPRFEALYREACAWSPAR